MLHLSGAGSADAVELDAKVPDTTGTYGRQIDVWLPRSREIVECKDYGRRVSVGVIDALAGTRHDIGALGGRVFSPSGFTKIALARAEKAGIECVQLPYKEPPELYAGASTWTFAWGRSVWASTLSDVSATRTATAMGSSYARATASTGVTTACAASSPISSCRTTSARRLPRNP
ncbi:restriction endonuclease [Streptomyces sp. NPDC048350]|uniref:restriction endonuclease n=1 Tax=Streptomyces sp. NPDC048350 TaxID=3365538 RepID=UPI00371BBE1D